MDIKPIWATGEGVEKKCLKCEKVFRDYTKKQTHTVCMACWKIRENQNKIKGEKHEKADSRKKGRNYQCKSCKGTGKDRIWEDYFVDEPCSCCSGTGMGEIEGASDELDLGR